MHAEDGDLFVALDPPGGGLEGLRQKMAREPARRLQLAAAFMLLAATLGLATKLPFGGRELRLPVFEQARMRLGMSSHPSEPLKIPEEERSRAAARRISSVDEKVLFYLVGSTSRQEL
jgi:hypothetical protein